MTKVLVISFKESADITIGQYLGIDGDEDRYARDIENALQEFDASVTFEGDKHIVVALKVISEEIAKAVTRRVGTLLLEDELRGLLKWEVRASDEGDQYVALIIEEDGPDTGCEVFGPFRERSEAKSFADKAVRAIYDAYEENRIYMGPYTGYCIRIGVGPNPDLGMTPDEQLEKALFKIEERGMFLYHGIEE